MHDIKEDPSPSLPLERLAGWLACSPFQFSYYLFPVFFKLLFCCSFWRGRPFTHFCCSLFSSSFRFSFLVHIQLTTLFKLKSLEKKIPFLVPTPPPYFHYECTRNSPHNAAIMPVFLDSINNSIKILADLK